MNVLVNKLSNKSHGIFKPENISETAAPNCTHLSFTLNDKIFECDLDQIVWDTNIFWLVNKSLKAINSKSLLCAIEVPEKFYSDYVSHRFIDVEVYKKMISLGIMSKHGGDIFYSNKMEKKF